MGAGTHVLRVPAGKVSEKIALLKVNPRVRYAEPDYVVQADMTPNDPSTGSSGELTPACFALTAQSIAVIAPLTDP